MSIIKVLNQIFPLNKFKNLIDSEHHLLESGKFHDTTKFLQEHSKSKFNKDNFILGLLNSIINGSRETFPEAFILFQQFEKELMAAQSKPRTSCTSYLVNNLFNKNIKSENIQDSLFILNNILSDAFIIYLDQLGSTNPVIRAYVGKIMAICDDFSIEEVNTLYSILFGNASYVDIMYNKKDVYDKEAYYIALENVYRKLYPCSDDALTSFGFPLNVNSTILIKMHPHIRIDDRECIDNLGPISKKLQDFIVKEVTNRRPEYANPSTFAYKHDFSFLDINQHIDENILDKEKSEKSLNQEQTEDSIDISLKEQTAETSVKSAEQIEIGSQDRKKVSFNLDSGRELSEIIKDKYQCPKTSIAFKLTSECLYNIYLSYIFKNKNLSNYYRTLVLSESYAMLWERFDNDACKPFFFTTLLETSDCTDEKYRDFLLQSYSVLDQVFTNIKASISIVTGRKTLEVNRANQYLIENTQKYNIMDQKLTQLVSILSSKKALTGEESTKILRNEHTDSSPVFDEAVESLPHTSQHQVVTQLGIQLKDREEKTEKITKEE